MGVSGSRTEEEEDDDAAEVSDTMDEIEDVELREDGRVSDDRFLYDEVVVGRGPISPSPSREGYVAMNAA